MRNLLTLVVVNALALTCVYYVGTAAAQQQPPDLTGTWQVLASDENAAPYVASASGSNGQIPYAPEALAQQRENAQYWFARDPVLTECSSPGIPRATYISNLIKIQQDEQQIVISYEFGDPRVVYMTEYQEQPRGRWRGNTFIIEDVPADTQYTWIDGRGNYYPNTSTVVERYNALSSDLLMYDVTITDESSFTDSWTISIPLTRVADGQLRTIECGELVEELVTGRSGNEDVVVPRGELVAWERYPSGLFFSRGDTVARISPGERYRVIERKVIPSLLSGESYYFRIAPLGLPDNPCANRDCWVYAGDGVQSNLEPVRGGV